MFSSSGNSNTPLGASPLHLFDLTFQLASNAAPGIYNLRFRVDAEDDSILGPVNVNSASLSPGNLDLDFEGGSFQITAVPEPSSMVLGAIAGAGFLHRLRRRSKKNKSAAPAA